MKDSHPYFNREAETLQTHGNLPHWSQDAKLYFITFRLSDSMPAYVLERIQNGNEWRQQVIALHGYIPEEHSAKFEMDKHNQMMHYLDAGHGCCWLRNPAVRKILEKCISRLDNAESKVHCYVIMPNHVHIIIETTNEASATKLIGTIKSVSSHLINKYLGRKGKLWQHESYDRIIRNGLHYWRAVRYIVRNTMKCPTKSCTLYLPEELKQGLNQLNSDSTLCSHPR